MFYVIKNVLEIKKIVKIAGVTKLQIALFL